MEGTVFVTCYDNNKKNIKRLLEATDLKSALRKYIKSKGKTILIKPNMVNSGPPPITTPNWVVAELVNYIADEVPEATIVVADGTGDVSFTTLDLFGRHGYLGVVQGVDFQDLNDAPLRQVEIKGCRRWSRMWLPEILFSSFLISVPVLKVHTLAGVTLSMKNMIGVCPPSYYQQDGHWKKSAFHYRIHDSILDLNTARKPDFVFLDASVGLSESHLGGSTCKPPVNRFVSGFDPVAVDAYGCKLLGKDWRDIGHIRDAHKVLGLAEPLEIIEV